MTAEPIPSGVFEKFNDLFGEMMSEAYGDDVDDFDSIDPETGEDKLALLTAKLIMTLGLNLGSVWGLGHIGNRPGNLTKYGLLGESDWPAPTAGYGVPSLIDMVRREFNRQYPNLATVKDPSEITLLYGKWSLFTGFFCYPVQDDEEFDYWMEEVDVWAASQATAEEILSDIGKATLQPGYNDIKIGLPSCGVIGQTDEVWGYVCDWCRGMVKKTGMTLPDREVSMLRWDHYCER